MGERRRERQRDHACTQELIVADRSVFGQECLSPLERQVAPEHREIDRRVAAADVHPVDHACRARSVVDEHLPEVEVAVDDRESVRRRKALGGLE